jgi:hypothetical protein
MSLRSAIFQKVISMVPDHLRAISLVVKASMPHHPSLISLAV